MSGSAGLLLDLGILTRVRGPRPDPEVVQFLHGRRHQRIFISALTLCELALRGPDSDVEGGAGPAEGWLRELAERFAANILPVDHHIALACGPGDHGAPQGSRGPGSSAVLAATARRHRLTVVSADAARYAGLNIRVLGPVAAPGPGQEPAVP